MLGSPFSNKGLTSLAAGNGAKSTLRLTPCGLPWLKNIAAAAAAAAAFSFSQEQPMFSA